MKIYRTYVYETGSAGTALITDHILASRGLTKEKKEENLCLLKNLVCVLQVLSHLIDNPVL